MTAARASAAQYPQMKRLWKTCFGDTDAYIDGFFSRFKDAAVVTDGEKLCAMAFLLPVSYLQPDGEEQRGAYLYAVCTEPSQRNKGCCRAVCAEAERLARENGADFLFLRPAEPSLGKLYEKLGYKLSFTAEETAVSAAPQPKVRIRTLTASEYSDLRQLQLWSECIVWPLEALEQQAAQGKLLCAETYDCFALAAVEGSGEDLLFKEYLGDRALAGAIVSQLGTKNASLRTPGDAPFAMAKALTDKPLPTGYAGFVFD